MKFIGWIGWASLCMAGMVQAEQPNMIIIINDDQGYADLGCYGATDLRTPHIDRMAAEGMKFTDFYVASPVCSASRAALLTGCYPKRLGVKDVYFPNRGHTGLDPKHVTIAEMLKTVGYATKAIGKWHLGDGREYLPTNQGFDSYYGIPYSNDMHPSKDMTYAEDCLFREGESKAKLDQAFARELSKNGSPEEYKNKVPLMRDEVCIEFPADQTTITQRFTTEGMAFISESVKAKQPFFLYLANSMPHTPLYVSPDFSGKSKRGLYGDAIEEIDFNVGRILDHLEKLGIAQNTFIILLSDNGPVLRGAEGGSARPLFEGKRTNFEGGHRVPAIVRWPRQVPAGSVCKEIASSMDLMPTLAHIAGAEVPTVMSLDGKNIIDLLTAQAGATSSYDAFYYGTLAVRSGPWKYHVEERFKEKETTRNHKGPTLYHLEKDIGESQNLIDQYPEIAERMKKLMDQNPNQEPPK